MTVLIDTNILLDVLLRREPYWTAAAKVWTLAEQGRVEAWISAISHNNIFYIVERLEDAAKARQSLRLIRQIFRTVATDEELLDAALGSPIRDYEDAIQYHSALKTGARYLVTRNPRDFPRHDDLEVVSPDVLIAAMASAAGPPAKRRRVSTT